MTTFGKVVLATALNLALCASSNAGTITYNLAYTDGSSFGTGQVTIESSVLTPNQSLITSVPTNFIDSFSLTFFNFPNNGPITFGLSDIGQVRLTTGHAGEITDFNLWSYDRQSLGSNTCPPCTAPYLAGVAPLFGTVTDPAHNNALIAYNISLTPAIVPEPSGFWLLLTGGLAGFLKRKLAS